MILVLADDITGAAEIAGTALRYGMTTSLITGVAGKNFPDTEVVVYATDVRSMSHDKACEETKRICEDIKRKGFAANDADKITIFKKTDSVLRGHIASELSIIMEQLGCNSSLLLPQNPSKGRIIRKGEYFINEERLSNTMFRKDPEFPATSSDPIRLIHEHSGKVTANCRILHVEGSLHNYERGEIFVAEAASEDDIIIQIDKSNKDMLMAGGADLFETFIRHKLKRGKEKERKRHEISIRKGEEKILVVSGSTQGKSIMQTDMMKRLHAQEATMPESVFEGASPKGWIEEIGKRYLLTDALIIRIGNHEFKGSEYAIRLRDVMGEATKELINTSTPRYLIIEGGATAFSILSHIKWTEFEIRYEFSPGVVGMRHGETEIILKPGSYPWEKMFM